MELLDTADFDLLARAIGVEYDRMPVILKCVSLFGLFISIDNTPSSASAWLIADIGCQRFDGNGSHTDVLSLLSVLVSGSFLMTVSGCVGDDPVRMILFTNGFRKWNFNFLRSGEVVADLELMSSSTALLDALHTVFMDSQAKAL